MSKEIVKDDGTVDEAVVNEMFDKIAEENRVDAAAPPAADPASKETVRQDDVKEPSGDGAAIPADDEQGSDDGWASRDDIRELVESLGYSAEDMAEFGGRDEFDRHVRLMDRTFLKAGKTEFQPAERPGDQQEAALRAQEESESRESQRERAAKQPREGGKFVAAKESIPDLDPEEFDERLVKVVEAAKQRIDSLEGELEQLRSGGQRQVMQDFDRIVDELGHDDMFGKTSEISRGSEAYKLRSRLWDSVRTLAAGMIATGRSVDGISKALVVRALNQEFADVVQKKNQQQFASRVRKQAGRRFGGGGQQAAGAPWTGDPAKDPVLLAAYKAMESENG